MDEIVSALQGYLDDSSDDDFFAIGGHVADLAGWNRFKPAWRAALAEREFALTHFHMRELTRRVGAFKTWTKGVPEVEERVARLLQRLAEVIRDSGLEGFACVVSRRDLERFNREISRDLDIKALAVYGCILEIRRSHPTDDIELILDRMTGANDAIALAEKYARSDAYYPCVNNFPTTVPLPKTGNTGAREMQELQASDFLAWEIRKNCQLKKETLERIAPTEPSFGSVLMNDWLRERMEHMVKHNIKELPLHWPPQRRSLTALHDAPTSTFLWHYELLRAADQLRNGVWLPPSRRLKSGAPSAARSQR